MKRLLTRNLSEDSLLVRMLVGVVSIATILTILLLTYWNVEAFPEHVGAAVNEVMTYLVFIIPLGILVATMLSICGVFNKEESEEPCCHHDKCDSCPD